MTNGSTIVSLDPGATIGICILHKDGTYESRQLQPADYPHPHETVFDVLSEIKPDRILYERFDYRAAKNGVVLIGVEYIGVIEMYGQMKCVDTHKISASDGKAFWTDNKLRLLNIYRRGMPHANDATRIMNTYRMKNDKEWFNKIVEELREALV